MASKSIIRKKPMQGVGMRVLDGTLLAVSATGGMYAMNKFLKPESKFKPYSGLVGMALHLGAEVFVEQPQILAVARGLGAAGALHTTGNLLLKGSKADFGLAGSEQPAAAKETVQETDATPSWAKFAAMVENENTDREPMSGVYNYEKEKETIPMQGIGAAEQAEVNMLLAA